MATNIIMQHEADSLTALMFVSTWKLTEKLVKVSTLHEFTEQSFFSARLYGTKFLFCMTLRNKVSTLHDFTEQNF